jgi:hypothetical protein
LVRLIEVVSCSTMERARTWVSLWEYIDKYGRMVDTYTGRDSMFTVARRGARDGTAAT